MKGFSDDQTTGHLPGPNGRVGAGPRSLAATSPTHLRARFRLSRALSPLPAVAETSSGTGALSRSRS